MMIFMIIKDTKNNAFLLEISAGVLQITNCFGLLYGTRDRKDKQLKVFRNGMSGIQFGLIS